jgi:hypothetical protein
MKPHRVFLSASNQPKGSDVAALSNVICWSRMQAEAGQGLATIIARKELERRAGNGLFFWGVGNAPGPAPAALARAGQGVDAVFSIMKSRPKQIDVAPAEVLVWRAYIDVDGVARWLPDHVLVTSRAHTNAGEKRAHYALMCRSEEPVELCDLAPFDPTAYRNASGKGAPIGASQVTALLRRVGEARLDTSYRVNFRAQLTGSYWVKLVRPVRLAAHKRTLLERPPMSFCGVSVGDWRDFVSDLLAGEPVQSPYDASQQALF